MTYTGGMREVLTLAHELGHAFHSWAMRDLPIQESQYPMTLAETASTFAEAATMDHLIGQATTDTQRLALCWSDLREAETFLLNIPARFHFEKAFYERRQAGPVAASGLKDLMLEAWQNTYGDTLAAGDAMFWASKLHFSLASVSFYNFPYTFGYLFSLGIFARRAELGEKFYPAYVALLRDTGRMTAEDVARRHLGVDLTQPGFWDASLKIIEAKVTRVEALAS
jgi:oligoendopeptidase F